MISSSSVQIAVLTALFFLQTNGATGREHLRLSVIEGQGAVNIVTSRHAKSPVAEVRDGKNRPLKGIMVTFVLPKVGTRAEFEHGEASHSAWTGKDGRAVAAPMRPVGEGPFEIKVQVERKKERGEVVIKQTNFATEALAEAANGKGVEAQVASLRIQILEGDDGVNILDKKTAVRPVVRVLDRNYLPVAAVPVTFVILASRGATAEFPGGQHSVTVVTDANGRAAVNQLTPSGKGSYQIRVQVNAPGQVLTRTVTQTNFINALAAQAAGKVVGASAAAESSTSATAEVAASGSHGASAGASSAASTTTTTTAASASAGASGGLSAGTLALAGLGVAGAAAGGIAAATNSSSQKDCSSLASQLDSAFNNEVRVCGSSASSFAQCTAAAQSALNVLGQLCSCAGGAGNLTSEERQLLQSVRDMNTQMGSPLTLPSSCGY